MTQTCIIYLYRELNYDCIYHLILFTYFKYNYNSPYTCCHSAPTNVYTPRQIFRWFNVASIDFNVHQLVQVITFNYPQQFSGITASHKIHSLSLIPTN